MASRRFVVFVKFYSGAAWVELLTFFRQDEAESYAAAIKACYPNIERCVVQPREAGFAVALARKCDS